MDTSYFSFRPFSVRPVSIRPVVAVFSLALSAALIFAPAHAQELDYKQRTADMTALSGIFGELHHLRRMCEPRRESDVWRERMKGIITHEKPTKRLQEQLVNAFNKGYRSAQGRYDECSRRAEDYAAARAAEGSEIVERLVAPFYETAGNYSIGGPVADDDED
ncbi:MAG: TIGR02301 family protein [Pseudomonadota bacterium]